MRAKQSTTQFPQSSLAQTILPSTDSGRGRKSRGAEAPEAAVAPPAPAPPAAPDPAPPVWSTPSPASAPPAPTAAPLWAPAPDWGAPSTSRFGTAPAPLGTAPANPQFGVAPVTDCPTNYPAAPGFPPQPHYADSPGGDYLPPLTAGQWVPQHFGSQYGVTPAAPPAYGPPPFGAPGYGGYPVGATPGRSTASRVLIGLAIAVLGIIGVGILAAIAIPVFLNQRDKPVPVTLVLPQTLEGSPQLNSASFQQLESNAESTVFPANTVFSDPQAAVYGNAGAPSFVIMAAKITSRPTASDRTSYWNAIARSGSDKQITLTKVPPGALGGTTECGLANSDVPFEVCFSLDNSAAVYVIVYTSDLVQGTLLAQKLREDVEHH
jgi:hypothetical protein